MLDEAGYPRDGNGIRFSMRGVWSGGRDFESRAAEVIRSQLEEVGIDYVIETYDRPDLHRQGLQGVGLRRGASALHDRARPDHERPVALPYGSDPKGAFSSTRWAIRTRNSMRSSPGSTRSRIARSAPRPWREAQRILMEDLPALPLFEMPAENLGLLPLRGRGDDAVRLRRKSCGDVLPYRRTDQEGAGPFRRPPPLSSAKEKATLRRAADSDCVVRPLCGSPHSAGRSDGLRDHPGQLLPDPRKLLAIPSISWRGPLDADQAYLERLRERIRPERTSLGAISGPTSERSFSSTSATR